MALCLQLHMSMTRAGHAPASTRLSLPRALAKQWSSSDLTQSLVLPLRCWYWNSGQQFHLVTERIAQIESSAKLWDYCQNSWAATTADLHVYICPAIPGFLGVGQKGPTVWLQGQKDIRLPLSSSQPGNLCSDPSIKWKNWPLPLYFCLWKWYGSRKKVPNAHVWTPCPSVPAVVLQTSDKPSWTCAELACLWWPEVTAHDMKQYQKPF